MLPPFCMMKRPILSYQKMKQENKYGEENKGNCYREYICRDHGYVHDPVSVLEQKKEQDEENLSECRNSDYRNRDKRIWALYRKIHRRK